MDYTKLVKEANRAFTTADHMAYTTYPLVNDMKMLIVILENLYLSLVLGMESILIYDRSFKRIPPYTDNLAVKLETFKNKSSSYYSIPRNYTLLMEEIRKILEQHKRSSTVFRRENKLIIMSENFRMQTLTIEKVKQYVQETKPLITKINRILGQNGLFNR